MGYIAIDGKEVITIESLANDGSARGGNLRPLQKDFIDHGAFQCSYGRAAAGC